MTKLQTTSSQGPTAPTATAVLMNLTAEPGVDRQVLKHMYEEMRDTTKLYLEGKIQQWYSARRRARRCFHLQLPTVDEAKALHYRLSGKTSWTGSSRRWAL
jgi:hypothetical protein